MIGAVRSSYEQYLPQLTQRECESRRRNRIAALLRESGLPREKTMARNRLHDFTHSAAGDQSNHGTGQSTEVALD